MRQVLGVRERFGADHTINLNEYPTSEARLERVMQLTGGKGVDLAVEVVGRPEVVAEGLEMLCPGGTYLTMGLVTGGLISNLDLEKVVHKGGSRSSVRATTRHGFYPRCSTCWSELVISIPSISSCRTNSSLRTLTKGFSYPSKAR